MEKSKEGEMSKKILALGIIFFIVSCFSDFLFSIAAGGEFPKLVSIASILVSGFVTAYIAVFEFYRVNFDKLTKNENDSKFVANLKLLFVVIAICIAILLSYFIFCFVFRR